LRQDDNIAQLPHCPIVGRESREGCWEVVGSWRLTIAGRIGFYMFLPRNDQLGAGNCPIVKNTNWLEFEVGLLRDNRIVRIQKGI